MAARRSRKKRAGGGTRSAIAIALLAGLAVGILVGAWLFRGLGGPPPAAPEAGEPIAGPEIEAPPVPPEPEGQASPPAYPPGGGARVALVFDDLGYRTGDVDRLADLGVPLTTAVLPFASRTAEVASGLSRRGFEIICHLPMQPRAGSDPGPGALTREMGREELLEATRAALDAVPAARGVNNHMGSELSADSEAMRLVLSVVAERGLFYLDSRTSAESVGYATALALGVPAAKRQVFLDADPEPEAVTREFARLLALARRSGAAVAIGHPHEETLEILLRRIPAALAAGYEFVPVSYLLDRAGGPQG